MRYQAYETKDSDLKVYSVNEAMEYLGVGKTTIYAYIKKGILSFRRSRNRCHRVFTRDDLDAARKWRQGYKAKLRKRCEYMVKRRKDIRAERAAMSDPLFVVIMRDSSRSSKITAMDKIKETEFPDVFDTATKNRKVMWIGGLFDDGLEKITKIVSYASKRMEQGLPGKIYYFINENARQWVSDLESHVVYNDYGVPTCNVSYYKRDKCIPLPEKYLEPAVVM